MSRPKPARAIRPSRPGAPGESCVRNGDETYCVSSVLRPQFGNSYGAQNLFAGSSASAWVEGRDGNGVGEWITIEFDGMRLVKSIIVRNGYQKSNDIFRKNNRVRRLRVMFSQGETQTLSAAGSSRSGTDHPPQTGEGLLDEIHHRRGLGRQQIHRYRDHEAGGRLGTSAVIGTVRK